VIFEIVGDGTQEHSDPPHPLALLRARCERPRDCRAAEQRDELATFHCQWLPCFDGKIAHTSMREETAALRNFYPAYDRLGSSATKAIDGRVFECPLRPIVPQPRSR